MSTKDDLRVRGRLDGEWVYGHEFRDGGHVYICPHGGGALCVVSPESIQRSTGFHDRNHREIYIGDILRVSDSPSKYIDRPHSYLVEGKAEGTLLIAGANVEARFVDFRYDEIVWHVRTSGGRPERWSGNWRHTQIVGSHTPECGTVESFTTLAVENPILPSGANLKLNSK